MFGTDRGGRMDPIDYGASFLRWARPPREDSRTPGHRPWGNEVRILLDARVRVTDERADTTQDFYLIAPCRTEWTFQDEPMFQREANEYRVAWSLSRRLSVARRRTDPTKPRASAAHGDQLSMVDVSLTPLRASRVLTDDLAVVEAGADSAPMVGQTELVDEQRERRAVLEYPIKTLNFLRARQRFQVDTGPLLFVDLASDLPEPIDWLRLAHIAFNRFQRAEFAKLGAAPVERDGRVVCEVEDYVHIHAQDARHRLYVGSTNEPS
jgi:hypothetical protein